MCIRWWNYKVKIIVSLFARPLPYAVDGESPYSLAQNKTLVPSTVLYRCFDESFAFIFGDLVFVFKKKSTDLQRAKCTQA